MSLFWRVFAINAAVLTAATGLVLLAPVSISSRFVVTEALILTGGLAAMLLANALLLRAGLAPLRRLTRSMATIDLLQPGPRIAAAGPSGVSADLIATFNTMLDRLEAERATSNARALSAQEDERRRIAQELHDEVGQSLTAVLLELKRTADHASPDLHPALHHLQETTRETLDEVRRIAHRLRPGVLAELGLVAALRSLFAEPPAHHPLQVRRDLATDLPTLTDAAELVIYRVAQEAVTNIARHAGATRAGITLSRHGECVRLEVCDDGVGIGAAGEGAGIRGMRERALLVGATLALRPATGGGTRVRLDVPLAGNTATGATP